MCNGIPHQITEGQYNNYNTDGNKQKLCYATPIFGTLVNNQLNNCPLRHLIEQPILAV